MEKASCCVDLRLHDEWWTQEDKDIEGSDSENYQGNILCIMG